jgi:hypothetical protein
MVLGRWLIVLMGANLYDVNGFSKRNSGLMVLLTSTKQGFLQKAIPKKKGKIILILIHL